MVKVSIPTREGLFPKGRTCLPREALASTQISTKHSGVHPTFIDISSRASDG